MRVQITASACLNRMASLARQMDELATYAGRLNPVAHEEIDRCSTCRAISGDFASSLEDMARLVAEDEDERAQVPVYGRAA